MSWGRFNHFNPYQGPARAGMRRYPAPKPPPCAVVVIDEDDDASDSEVFIIDGAPAPSPAPAAGCQAGKGKSSSGNVINIDDDEDVEEGPGWAKAGPSTSCARSGSPASSTPGRGSPGNRYGFDSESSSSDSDLSEGWDFDTDDGSSSDCEILAAREMWESAASRKKTPHGVNEHEDGRATAFGSRAGSHKNSEGLFGAGCNLNETYFSPAWKGDSQNKTRGTKEGSERAQSSANGAKDDHGPSLAPNTRESSNGNVGKGTERFQSPFTDGTFVSANRVFTGNSSADRKYGSPPMSVSTPEKIDEKIPDGVYSQKDQSPQEPYNNTDMHSAEGDGFVGGQQKEVPPFTSRCDCSRQSQANLCACEASGSCSLPRKDLNHDPEELGQFASVIGEREKHKESIEYKRAAEEEWASRQRQLQLQAEEAKKLRKRKKAEAQRLLEMEKRQRQRLEEVRESQRKNEEAIQIKEQYRGVVRKELEDMERKYWNMTSILRALGISVEGGEVKAYKQALLKFHPDRVSRNDVYQQVKAEETFKFISRLKEKLQRFP